MKLQTVIALFATILLCGCAQLADRGAVQPRPRLRSYRASNYDWRSVRRIMVLPLGNETQFPNAAVELARELAAELQASGQFEVILAPSDMRAQLAERLRLQGCFDEMLLVEIAHNYHVDGVIFGTVTQYRPYSPPGIGLSLQLVSVGESVVIASCEGLWDARDQATADQTRQYYRTLGNSNQTLLAADTVLASPQLYQRFVCHQVALAWAGQ